MDKKQKMVWAVIPALLLVVGAKLTAEPPQTTAKPAPAARPSAAARPPAPRERVQLGKAPQPTFQVNNQKFNVDAKAPAVKAVRAIPPQAFQATARKTAVNNFVNTELAGKPVDKTKLTHMVVGPFRNEFVYWAYYDWAMPERALWAWNNYAYFNQALWAEWMTDPKFAVIIQSWQKANKPQVLGYVPPKYASEPAAVVYNDAYIQAVYNPVLTPPSIVIDATAGLELANLVEGASRVVGAKPVLINTVTNDTVPLQFSSLPAGFGPTYVIDVKRDGLLYVFGPRTTKLAEGLVGDSVTNWQPVAKFVTGPGIDAVYERKVKAGEKIHLHGTEWSVASEQIELFSPASKDAITTSKSMVSDLSRLLDGTDDFVTGAPELKGYLQSARDAASGVLTANGNVDEDRVADCHYELARVVKLAQLILSDNRDPKVAKSGKGFLRQIKLLQGGMNDVTDLRDPSLGDQPVAAEVPAQDTGGNNAAAAAPEGTIDLLKLVMQGDLASTTTGDWKKENGQIKCGSVGQISSLPIPYHVPLEYDLTVTLVRSSGDQIGVIARVQNRARTEWWIGLKDNKTTQLSNAQGTGENATTTQSETGWIKNGDHTTLEMHVRKGQVETIIDGNTAFTAVPDDKVTGLDTRARQATKGQQLCIEVAPKTEVSIESIKIVEHK